jgi:hypothetical protein
MSLYLEETAAADRSLPHHARAAILVLHPSYEGALAFDGRFAAANGPTSAPTRLLSSDGRVVAVSFRERGGAAVAAEVEHLHSAGTREVVVLSTGIATRAAEEGDLLLVSRALRDDLVSDYYLPSSAFVDADQELTRRLAEAWAHDGLPTRLATSWTIPSGYQASAATVAGRARDGVDVVECETASVFAAARALGLAASACTVAAPALTGQSLRAPWPPRVLAAVLAAVGAPAAEPKAS